MTKRFRCIDCKRLCHFSQDQSMSHREEMSGQFACDDFQDEPFSRMCHGCWDKIETHLAILDARHERHGRRLSHHALVAIAELNGVL